MTSLFVLWFILLYDVCLEYCCVMKRAEIPLPSNCVLVAIKGKRVPKSRLTCW